jgi:hypothetical protein
VLARRRDQGRIVPDRQARPCTRAIARRDGERARGPLAAARLHDFTSHVSRRLAARPAAGGAGWSLLFGISGSDPVTRARVLFDRAAYTWVLTVETPSVRAGGGMASASFPRYPRLELWPRGADWPLIFHHHLQNRRHQFSMKPGAYAWVASVPKHWPESPKSPGISLDPVVGRCLNVLLAEGLKERIFRHNSTSWRNYGDACSIWRLVAILDWSLSPTIEVVSAGGSEMSICCKS